MSEVDISRAAFWGSRTSKTRSVSSCLRLRIGLSDVCRDETDLTFALADDVYVDEDEDEDDDDDDDLTCLSAFRGFFFARGLIANGLDFLDLTTGGSTVSELDLSSSSSSLSSSSLLSSSSSLSSSLSSSSLLTSSSASSVSSSSSSDEESSFFFSASSCDCLPCWLLLSSSSGACGGDSTD